MRPYVGRAWHPNQYPHIPFELNRDSPQAQGLVAWWPTLDSAGANVLRDFGGRGLNGAFPGGTANPSWVGDGQFGNVLSFDGEDDRIQIANSSSLTNHAQFTAGGWFYVKSWGNWARIINKDDFGGNDRWYISHNNGSGRLFATLMTPAMGGVQAQVYQGNVLLLNQWNHIAYIYDGSSLKLFVNGVSDIGSTVETPFGSYTGTSSILIGGKGNAVESMAGYTADTRIYNRALSTAEVWQQWAPQTCWDLYRPLVRRLWHVPIAVGWPRISPSLATVAPQGPRIGGIYVN